jgi:hypothetical protein
MYRRIIDSTGEILHLHSPALRKKLFLSAMIEPDSAPLVRNLGFIDLGLGLRGVSVTFRPKTVSRVAFAALNYWLYDQPPGRVLLSTLEPGHCSELYASRGPALARMQGLIDAHQAQDEQLFRRRALSLAAMPSQALAAVWAAWKISGTQSDFSALRHLLQRDLGDRFVVLRPDLEAGRFIIQEAGSGLRIPDPKWAKAQVGRPVDDVPDQAYGQWVANTYRSVLACGEPQVDAVEARIYWPATGRVLRRYARLIVPVQDQGRLVLLGVNDPSCSLGGHLEAA